MHGYRLPSYGYAETIQATASVGGLSGDTGCLSGFFMKPSGNIKSYKLETAKWVKAFATTPDESDPPKLQLETSMGTGCLLLSTCVEWQMCKHIQ